VTPIGMRAAVRRTLRDIRYVHAVPPGRATGLVRAVYAQLERDFGLLAPPVALHSPAPEVLAASWLMLRESLIASNAASRAEKEAVATAVSRVNTCPYCVEVHGMALAALGGPAAAEAIGEGRSEEIEDPGMRASAEWACGAGTVPSPEKLPELAAVAVTFHYFNRVVNVFLGPSPVPAGVPGAARGVVRALLGRAVRPRDGSPRASLDLLPRKELPAELSWAAGNATIAAAFAGARAAVADAGRRTVPEQVRELVRRELKSWDGRPPGPSRSWVTPLASVVPQAERPAARLALLVALSSFQVDEGPVLDFRRDRPDDRALVELVSWAAFEAARWQGSRLAGTSEVGKSTVNKLTGRPRS